MNRRTVPPVPALIFVLVLGFVLFFVGRLAWQWFTATEPERSPTLAEQVAGIPGVVDVEVATGRVPGGGSFRSMESTLVFDEQILADPQLSADRLAGVSLGWSQSAWSFEELSSTANVHYVSQLDPAPFAWWLQGVAALAEAQPAADLACDIRYGSLACEVVGGDPKTVREALADVAGAEVQAWIDQARPDPDQPHGFVLIVGGEQITDPLAGS